MAFEMQIRTEPSEFKYMNYLPRFISLQHILLVKLFLELNEK